MIRRAAALSFVVIAACGGAGSGPGPSAPTESSKSEGGGGASEPNDSAPAAPPKSLDCGDFSSCAVGSDGLVRCWGRNKDGELGQPQATKEQGKRATVPGLGKATDVALASQLSCAILENKHVKCWGSGKLGGKVLDNSQPTEVEGIDDAEEIEASGAIVCARGAKGIKCWGEDEKSIGTPPAGVFKQISTGFTHGCALDQKGAVTCWGVGDWGPKGKYTAPGVKDALEVVTGDRHACVIAKDKSVLCWGMNDSGQLGTKPDFTPHPKPAAVPGVKGATKLFAGETANCALLGDGTLKCWGSNNEGELGLGKQSTDERPTAVTGLSGVEHICFASAHACALTQEHKLYCWGSNNFGQIGDGTKERRTTPTAVAW
jgi:alpha-tubulin suppressor-like RCC1 family protein